MLGALGALAFAGGTSVHRGDSPLRDGQPADLAILPFEDGDSAALGRRLAMHAGLRLEWYPRWHMVPRLQSFAEWDADRTLQAPARHEVRGSLARRDGAGRSRSRSTATRPRASEHL